MRHKNIFILIFLCAAISRAHAVFAHCDTMDGPVITDARKALAEEDVNEALKWVKLEWEGEINQAFDETLSERKKGGEAAEKAETRFFEILVKFHREGEGEEFTGIKPAGSEIDPVVKEADLAIEFGSAEKLIGLLSKDAALGVRKRLEEVLEKKRHKHKSAEAGREFVSAYVDFVHYVEHLDETAKKGGSHGK
ncbi:MAG: DUF6448 family protein [Candidatus Omnitrophica bacterium]|nr:DUF6448 family protein [Candidatus Omnitrophota bacterium]